jgi:hypothetical protein
VSAREFASSAHLSWRRMPSTCRPPDVVLRQRRAHGVPQPFQVLAKYAESVANSPRGSIPVRYDQIHVLPRHSRRKTEGNRTADHRQPDREGHLARPRPYDCPIARVALKAALVVCIAKPIRAAFAKTINRKAWSHCILVFDQCAEDALPKQWIRLQQ